MGLKLQKSILTIAMAAKDDPISLGLMELFQDISERVSDAKPLEVEGGAEISDKERLRSLLNMEDGEEYEELSVETLSQEARILPQAMNGLRFAGQGGWGGRQQWGQGQQGLQGQQGQGLQRQGLGQGQGGQGLGVQGLGGQRAVGQGVGSQGLGGQRLGGQRFGGQGLGGQVFGGQGLGGNRLGMDGFQGQGQGVGMGVRRRQGGMAGFGQGQAGAGGGLGVGVSPGGYQQASALTTHQEEEAQYDDYLEEDYGTADAATDATNSKYDVGNLDYMGGLGANRRAGSGLGTFGQNMVGPRRGYAALAQVGASGLGGAQGGYGGAGGGYGGAGGG